MSIARRPWLCGMALWGFSSRWTLAHADPSRKLQNRLELWANFAGRTQNLRAQVRLRRESALLERPLAVTGTLFFRTPDALLLRDDDPAGISTWIERGVLRLVPHRADVPAPELPDRHDPASEWLVEHLVAMFAPPPPGELGFPRARVLVPPGSGYRLEFAPLRGSLARRVVRTMTVQLDPVAGAVTRIVLAEAQGDRLSIDLEDHRQNLDPADIAGPFEALRSRVGG